MTLTRPPLAVVRLGFAVTFIVITYLALSPAPPSLVEEVNDKVEHILAFFTLALLVDLSFPDKKFDWTKWGPLLLYGALIEIIQQQIPNRDFSLLDLAADGVAVLAYGVTALLLKRLLPG